MPRIEAAREHLRNALQMLTPLARFKDATGDFCVSLTSVQHDAVLRRINEALTVCEVLQRHAQNMVDQPHSPSVMAHFSELEMFAAKVKVEL